MSISLVSGLIGGIAGLIGTEATRQNQPSLQASTRTTARSEIEEIRQKGLTEWAREHGAPELAVPKKIMRVAEVPVLGPGKTDYVAIQKLVQLDQAA